MISSFEDTELLDADEVQIILHHTQSLRISRLIGADSADRILVIGIPEASLTFYDLKLDLLELLREIRHVVRIRFEKEKTEPRCRLLSDSRKVGNDVDELLQGFRQGGGIIVSARSVCKVGKISNVSKREPPL